MRKLKPFAVGAVLAVAAFVVIALSARPAAADEAPAKLAQGTGVQTCTDTSWQGGTKLAVQCQNVDGGGGQRVYYQPIGCGNPAACDGGAGPGGIMLDYTLNADAVPITLRAGATGLAFKAVDGVSAVYCVCAGRSP